MKTIFYLLLFTLFSFKISYGQKTSNYKDLLILFVDGDYEGCVKKAKKYIKKPESVKDEFPYLVTSAAYFAISKDQVFDRKYPNAYEDAFKYASLTSGKTRDSSSYAPIINSFLPDLVMSAIENVRYSMATNDSLILKKVISRMDQIITFNPLEPGFYLIKSAAQNYLNDTLFANVSYDKGIDLMKKVLALDNMSKTGRFALKTGLFMCAEYYRAYGQESRGLRVLKAGLHLYSEDEMYKKELDQNW